MKHIAKRNLLIDAAKGLGILFVVLGHAFQTTIPDFDNMGFRFIYSFHMPLFMFLSGCVAKYGDYRSITKNITRLVVPFLSWFIVVALIAWVRIGHMPNFANHMYNLFKGPDNGLWFLWVLFLCHCIFYLMSLAQKYIHIFAAFLVFIAVQFIPLNVLGVGLLKWHFVFFVSGYLVMQYKENIAKSRNALMLLPAFIYFLLFPYWQFISNDLFLNALSIKPETLTIGVKYLVLSYRYMTAFAGIGLIISLVYFAIKLSPVEIFLTTIGLYTLDIYVSHQLVLGYAFGSGKAIRIITIFINALCFSLLLGFILKKIPVIKTLLYGVVDKKPSNNVLPDGAQT